MLGVRWLIVSGPSRLAASCRVSPLLSISLRHTTRTTQGSPVACKQFSNSQASNDITEDHILSYGPTETQSLANVTEDVVKCYLSYVLCYVDIPAPIKAGSAVDEASHGKTTSSTQVIPMLLCYATRSFCLV
ncbi:hypothetical protein F4805DRAFT_89177 [Annulohypoxylon moriforme]|nr:hypothetical protein F4805DRAFT_89177 [Annulohypoxylon moriforme]